MLGVLRPTAEGIARRYEQRPNYNQMSDILVDEIQTGERGMLDVIRSYPEYVRKQQLQGLEPAPLSGFLNNAFSTKTGFKRYVEIADRVLGKDEGSQFVTSLDDTTQQVADQPTQTEKSKPVTKIDPRDMLSNKNKKAYNDAVNIENIDQENISFKKLKGQASEVTANEVGIPVSKLKPANNFSKGDLINSSKFIYKNVSQIRKLMPKGAVFKGRIWTNEIAQIIEDPIDIPEDVITSRILWLDGLEIGRNRGGIVDSKSRYIYIHGTAEEGLIGQPASLGCIRMLNDDVIEIFNKVRVGTQVLIFSNKELYKTL